MQRLKELVVSTVGVAKDGVWSVVSVISAFDYMLLDGSIRLRPRVQKDGAPEKSEERNALQGFKLLFDTVRGSRKSKVITFIGK